MNLKRFLTFLKHALLMLVMLTTIGITSCDDDDDNGPAVFDGTIMDLISDTQFKQSATVPADKALDSLVKYLSVNADLVALLDGTTDYTLFAPSNQAFINLLATPGFPSKISDISPNVIKGVLTYHMVEDELMKNELTEANAGAGFNTKYSHTNACTGAQTVQVIKVNSDGTLLTGSTNTEIDVIDADNLASNGVVHVVESVMVPPSIGASLTPILGKISSTILLGAQFTHLAKIVTLADCGTDGTDIAAMLSGPGPYTVFLPPNAVIEGTAAAWPGGAKTVDQLIATFTAAQWRSILLNHIVSGSNASTAFTDGADFATLQAGGALTVDEVTPAAPPGSPVGRTLTTSGASTGLGGTTNAPIYQFNAAPNTTNGIVHVVGKILIPN